ncbi:MAG: Concanavalin A-like lectin/glucanases superfamily protein/PA14 domain-containing protein [Verrucomicrobia bacterium]|nr:MAG: Concanavalin A-like lectin/glucanases superfamily protein/PA14 domain-containing protein [Verrucomicrobiota bacterium]
MSVENLCNLTSSVTELRKFRQLNYQPSPMNYTNKRSHLRGLLLTLPCLAVSAHAGLLVELNSLTLPLGPIASWENTGTLPGGFTSAGAPQVTMVDGIKAVTLGGGGDYLVGPIAPDEIGGVNPNRSVEVWAFNPSIAGEETLVAWGNRGGGDGTNFSFNYGADVTWGAAGQWGGGPDIGWNMVGGAPSAGTWHYLVITSDGGGAVGAGTTRVYADGVLRNSEFHGNLNTHLGNNILIGGQNQSLLVPGGFNSGLSIAKVRIHDTVLTPAAIAAKFTEELPQIYPKAYVTSAKVASTTSVSFTIQDQVPGSITVPNSFTVTPAGIRSNWNVQGGEGVINGSITSPPIVIPAGGPVEITLNHRYNFEGDEWDGGVIQVSVNGGDFVNVENSSFTANGYHEVPLIGNHVLNGQLAWNGASAGFATGTFIDSVATVPGIAAGDSVRFRFLGAWDEGYTPDGLDWQIYGFKVMSGATTVLNETFASSNGGFTAESTGQAGATWNYIAGNQPVLGPLQISKVNGVTTIVSQLLWAPGTEYNFTINGKDTANSDLVYTRRITTPAPPLAAARAWPATIPGPLGTANAWGVRTFLNNGINTNQNFDAMMDFLANSSDRTPELTPDTVVDSQNAFLNFYDPGSNGPNNGIIPGGLPFPGDALSTATNGGVARNDDYVVTSAHGTISITEASDYTFNIRGDDGSMFRIKRAEGGTPPKFVAVVNGQVDAAQQNIVYFFNPTGDTNVRAVTYLTPGTYKLEYATWEGGGGFFYQVSSAKGFFLNDSDTPTWRPVGYRAQTTAPVPYPSMAGDWTVLSTLPSGLTQVDIPGADAAVTAAVAADAVAATSSWAQINFFDPQSGGQGRIPGDVPWPRNTELDDNRYAMRMSGTLRIPESGEYLIGFQGDDGTKLTIGGSHSGFSALTENATGAGVIGRSTDVLRNSGSIGAVGDFNASTSAVFQQAGALAGSTDKAILVGAADAIKTRVEYTPLLNPAGDWSSEIWINATTIPGGLTCPISSGNFGDPRSGWLLYMDNINGWSFRGYQNVGLGTAFNITTATGAPTAGVWYHIVMTWKSATGTATLYVNGTLAGQQAGVTNFVPASAVGARTSGRLHIGSRADNAFGWGGLADEAAVYGTELTATQVLSHYENGTDPSRTKPYNVLVQELAPLGYWRLNDTSGNPRVDLGTITTDVPTGDNSTVGRIFLNAGDYPITTTFWEDGGGSYIEVFARRDAGNVVPFRSLINGGWPTIQDYNGLPLITTPPAPGPANTGLATLPPTVNPDGTMRVTFPSVATVVYDLQESANLQSWTTVTTVEATGLSTTINGVAGSYLYVDPSKPTNYYRVVARP